MDAGERLRGIALFKIASQREMINIRRGEGSCRDQFSSDADSHRGG